MTHGQIGRSFSADRPKSKFPVAHARSTSLSEPRCDALTKGFDRGVPWYVRLTEHQVPEAPTTTESSKHDRPSTLKIVPPFTLAAANKYCAPKCKKEEKPLFDGDEILDPKAFCKKMQAKRRAEKGLPENDGSKKLESKAEAVNLHAKTELEQKLNSNTDSTYSKQMKEIEEKSLDTAILMSKDLESKKSFCNRPNKCKHTNATEEFKKKYKMNQNHKGKDMEDQIREMYELTQGMIKTNLSERTDSKKVNIVEKLDKNIKTPIPNLDLNNKSTRILIEKEMLITSKDPANLVDTNPSNHSETKTAKSLHSKQDQKFPVEPQYRRSTPAELEAMNCVTPTDSLNSSHNPISTSVNTYPYKNITNSMKSTSELKETSPQTRLKDTTQKLINKRVINNVMDKKALDNITLNVLSEFKPSVHDNPKGKVEVIVKFMDNSPTKMSDRNNSKTVETKSQISQRIPMKTANIQLGNDSPSKTRIRSSEKTRNDVKKKASPMSHSIRSLQTNNSIAKLREKTYSPSALTRSPVGNMTIDLEKQVHDTLNTSEKVLQELADKRTNKQTINMYPKVPKVSLEYNYTTGKYELRRMLTKTQKYGVPKDLEKMKNQGVPTSAQKIEQDVSNTKIKKKMESDNSHSRNASSNVKKSYELEKAQSRGKKLTNKTEEFEKQTLSKSVSRVNPISDSSKNNIMAMYESNQGKETTPVQKNIPLKKVPSLSNNGLIYKYSTNKFEKPSVHSVTNPSSYNVLKDAGNTQRKQSTENVIQKKTTLKTSDSSQDLMQRRLSKEGGKNCSELFPRIPTKDLSYNYATNKYEIIKSNPKKRPSVPVQIYGIKHFEKKSVIAPKKTNNTRKKSLRKEKLVSSKSRLELEFNYETNKYEARMVNYNKQPTASSQKEVARNSDSLDLVSERLNDEYSSYGLKNMFNSITDRSHDTSKYRIFKDIDKKQQEKIASMWKPRIEKKTQLVTKQVESIRATDRSNGYVSRTRGSAHGDTKPSAPKREDTRDFLKPGSSANYPPKRYYSIDNNNSDPPADGPEGDWEMINVKQFDMKDLNPRKDYRADIECKSLSSVFASEELSPSVKSIRDLTYKINPRPVSFAPKPTIKIPRHKYRRNKNTVNVDKKVRIRTSKVDVKIYPTPFMAYQWVTATDRSANLPVRVNTEKKANTKPIRVDNTISYPTSFMAYQWVTTFDSSASLPGSSNRVKIDGMKQKLPNSESHTKIDKHTHISKKVSQLNYKEAPLADKNIPSKGSSLKQLKVVQKPTDSKEKEKLKFREYSSRSTENLKIEDKNSSKTNKFIPVHSESYERKLPQKKVLSSSSVNERKEKVLASDTKKVHLKNITKKSFQSRFPETAQTLCAKKSSSSPAGKEQRASFSGSINTKKARIKKKGNNLPFNKRKDTPQVECIRIKIPGCKVPACTDCKRPKTKEEPRFCRKVQAPTPSYSECIKDSTPRNPMKECPKNIELQPMFPVFKGKEPFPLPKPLVASFINPDLAVCCDAQKELDPIPCDPSAVFMTGEGRGSSMTLTENTEPVEEDTNNALLRLFKKLMDLFKLKKAGIEDEIEEVKDKKMQLKESINTGVGCNKLLMEGSEEHKQKVKEMIEKRAQDLGVTVIARNISRRKRPPCCPKKKKKKKSHSCSTSMTEKGCRAPYRTSCDAVAMTRDPCLKKVAPVPSYSECMKRPFPRLPQTECRKREEKERALSELRANNLSITTKNLQDAYAKCLKPKTIGCELSRNTDKCYKLAHLCKSYEASIVTVVNNNPDGLERDVPIKPIQNVGRNEPELDLTPVKVCPPPPIPKPESMLSRLATENPSCDRKVSGCGFPRYKLPEDFYQTSMPEKPRKIRTCPRPLPKVRKECSAVRINEHARIKLILKNAKSRPTEHGSHTTARKIEQKPTGIV